MIERMSDVRRFHWLTQERYYGRALGLRAEGIGAHSPHSCGCFACADLRVYLGLAPLKTDTERRCGL